MVKKIIMLTGKAGCGKDTLAGMLGSSWERVSFADAIRDMAVASTGLSMNTFLDRDLKDSVVVVDGEEITPREILIEIGMRFRADDPDHWAKIAVDKIEKSKKEFFVITDWRFPNEFDVVREFNEAQEDGHDDHVSTLRTVRLMRNDALRLPHGSEHALDGYWTDSFIVNSSTLQDLEGQARTLAAMMGCLEAQSQVYTSFLPQVKRVCFKHITNHSNLEDAAHDITKHIISLLPSRFNFTCSLWTFVYSVASRDIRNARRKLATYAKYISFNGDEHVYKTPVAPAQGAPYLGGKIEEALMGLDDRSQMVFHCKHTGWRHKEIAKVLDISEINSRQILNRAHKKLRVDLEEYYLELL